MPTAKCAPDGLVGCPDAIANGPPRIVGRIALPVLWALFPVLPLAAQDRDPMLLVDQDGTTVRAHLQFGLNAVVEDNLYWDLAATTAPLSDFNPDTAWLES
jgi:hypothetical protein